MITKLPEAHYDVAVIGGGIHGVSMACEAASRGLKVILLQGRDIAAGASSATSTMLSGNLRRVERFAWGQVRRNLIEQSLLLKRAPHLVQCRRYTIVPDAGVRSNKRLGAMLWVYRHLHQTHPQPETAPQTADAPQQRLKDPSQHLYHYADCSGLDYRLTLCTALQARSWGADIYPRHRVVAAHRQGRSWSLTVQPQQPAPPFTIGANCVINSCGWLANDLLNNVLKCPSRVVAKPLNVGYLIVRKTYPGEGGYVLQEKDKRLIYITPLLGKYLLIGPTLTADNGDRAGSESLLELYNRHFQEPLTPGDILHQRWAKHAVFDDPNSKNAVNQLGDTMLDLNNPYGSAPLLNVFGTNLLMHRLLSERGLNILRPFTGKKANPALKEQKLPGGESGSGASGELLDELGRAYPLLNKHLIERLARTYGSLSYQILGERRTPEDLGRDFGHQLFEAEVRYLCDHEWAQTADDILWRRTQLGITFTAAEAGELQQWLEQHGH